MLNGNIRIWYLWELGYWVLIFIFCLGLYWYIKVKLIFRGLLFFLVSLFYNKEML